MDEVLKSWTPADLRVPAQRAEVGGDFLPGLLRALPGSDLVQIEPASQYGMGPPEPVTNQHQPAGHQPRGDQAVWIHRQDGALKTLFPLLPGAQAQKQGADVAAKVYWQ